MLDRIWLFLNFWKLGWLGALWIFLIISLRGHVTDLYYYNPYQWVLVNIQSLNANISDGNFIFFRKILLYFWSKVEIKSLIDWEGSLQYSSKSLNFSQLSEISSFCNLRSRKSNYIWNPSSVLKSLIDKSLNASSEVYVHHAIAIPCLLLSKSVTPRHAVSSILYCSYVFPWNFGRLKVVTNTLSHNTLCKQPLNCYYLIIGNKHQNIKHLLLFTVSTRDQAHIF